MSTEPTTRENTVPPIVQATTRALERIEKDVEFIPFGAGPQDTIRLSAAMVRAFVAVPTKSGQLPNERDCIRFVMLCKAKKLNPFEQDAFLVGYDTQNGPQFSLLTAHQAFLKRAEASPEYDGMESGVCVVAEDGEYLEREGDLCFEAERLVGAWARVHFKTRSHPMFKRISRGVFDTKRSRWAVDPAGMLVKCAEADALRSSFPSLLGGLYIDAEIAQVRRNEADGESVDAQMMNETKARTEQLVRTVQDAAITSEREIENGKPEQSEQNEINGRKRQPRRAAATKPAKTETTKSATTTAPKKETKPNTAKSAQNAKTSPLAEPSKLESREKSAPRSSGPVEFPAFTGNAQAQTVNDQAKPKDIAYAKQLAVGLPDFDLETATYKRFNHVYLDELTQEAVTGENGLIPWLEHLVANHTEASE